MKKTALTLAALAFSVGIAGQAHAGSLATSVVEFTDFQIFWQGGDQLDYSDIQDPKGGGITYTSNADVSAEITGLGSDNPPLASTSDGTPIDLFADVGTHSYTNNDFTHISSTTPGVPGETFAIGDQNEIGSPITGLPGDTVDYGAGSPFADISSASYVSLTSDAIGSSTSNNTLSTTVEFVVGADVEDGTDLGNLVFDFNLKAFLEAFTDAGDSAPGFGSASFTVLLSLTDEDAGGAHLLGSPLNGFQVSCSDSNNAPSDSGTPANGSSFVEVADDTFVSCGLAFASGVDFSLTSGSILAGHRLKLDASITTLADARYVPEPSILALMGLGLLGMAGLRRRKKGLAA